MIGYKTLAKGQIDLNRIIQHPENIDLQLYEKNKQSTRQEDSSIPETQKHSLGYVSIVSLTSTIPNETDVDIRTNKIAIEKSFNDDEEYLEEEELNSELEDSDVELNGKSKQKFNRNLLREKFIQMFKRKPVQSTSNTTKPSDRTHQHHSNRQSDIEEEDPPSDISDSTIPVDQWSIESVPKPGFTPVEHLQILHFVGEDVHEMERNFCNDFSFRWKKNDINQVENQRIHSIVMIVHSIRIRQMLAWNPIESNCRQLSLKNQRQFRRVNVVIQQQNNWMNSMRMIVCRNRLFFSTLVSINRMYVFHFFETNPTEGMFFSSSPQVTSSKLQEQHFSPICLNSLTESKSVLNNLIQRIQKRFDFDQRKTNDLHLDLISASQTVIRIVLLGHDAFVNAFLQSYVECLASRPREYMTYFRFYFIPLGK